MCRNEEDFLYFIDLTKPFLCFSVHSFLSTPFPPRFLLFSVGVEGRPLFEGLPSVVCGDLTTGQRWFGVVRGVRFRGEGKEGGRCPSSVVGTSDSDSSTW